MTILDSMLKSRDVTLPTKVRLVKAVDFPVDLILSGLIDYAKAFDCVYQNKLWKILKEMGIPDHLTCLEKPVCRSGSNN